MEDNAEKQAEASPNFYREREEEEKTDLNESAASVTSSAASVGKMSATEFRSFPEVNHHNIPEGEADDELIEIERKVELVKTAATKRNPD